MIGKVHRTLMLVATFALCGLWLLAVFAKLSDPLTAYEFLSWVVPGGLFAKGAFAFGVAIEAFLGVSLLVGAVRSLVPSLAWLLVLTGSLFVASDAVGGPVLCGCLPGVLDSSAEDAIVRNYWLIGILLALVVLDHVVRQREGQAARDDVQKAID